MPKTKTKKIKTIKAKKPVQTTPPTTQPTPPVVQQQIAPSKWNSENFKQAAKITGAAIAFGTGAYFKYQENLTKKEAVAVQVAQLEGSATNAQMRAYYNSAKNLAPYLATVASYIANQRQQTTTGALRGRQDVQYYAGATGEIFEQVQRGLGLDNPDRDIDLAMRDYWHQERGYYPRTRASGQIIEDAKRMLGPQTNTSSFTPGPISRPPPVQSSSGQSTLKKSAIVTGLLGAARMTGVAVENAAKGVAGAFTEKLEYQ